jgi:hypothetical protein
MGDEKEIDPSDITIGNITVNDYYADSGFIGNSAADVDYDDWLGQYIGNIHLDDWNYSLADSHLGANNISLKGGGEEMLRIAEDGFYVRGVKVKQGKREARAVYEAFKRWMTHAIMSGELDTNK